MSKSQAFFDRLIVASQGVSSAERQAEARVRTNDFFNLGSKELKGEGAFAAAKEAEAEIQGLRAAASQDGNAPPDRGLRCRPHGFHHGDRQQGRLNLSGHGDERPPDTGRPFWFSPGSASPSMLTLKPSVTEGSDHRHRRVTIVA